jgi:hypothetical protein
MTQPAPSATYDLPELNRETTFGGIGKTKQRDVPRIDLGDFEKRKHEIAEQLWNASTEIGFFQLVNHGIPQSQIDEAFDMTARFFGLPHEVKAKLPMLKGTNWGWEYKSQVRPSTGTADNKESYQITVPRMANLWPGGDNLPGFKAAMLGFERANWALGMKVLSCFAYKLGFAPDFFTDAHDPQSPEYQSTLRLLHYLPMIDAKPEDFTGWRLRVPDAAAPAHGPGRPATLPRQGSRRTRLDRCQAGGRRHYLQYRRHAETLERRQAAIDIASRADAAPRRISWATLFLAVLLSGQSRRHCAGSGQGLSTGDGERLPASTHRGEFREDRLIARCARDHIAGTLVGIAVTHAALAAASTGCCVRALTAIRFQVLIAPIAMVILAISASEKCLRRAS